MIFRDTNGNLITVCRYDYPDDKSYYSKLWRIQNTIFLTQDSTVTYSEQLIRNVLKGDNKKHQKNEGETEHVTTEDIRG